VSRSGASPTIELQYARLTSNSAALGPAAADISGLSVTFTPPTSQVMLRLVLPLLVKDTSAGWVIAFITDSAGNIVNRMTRNMAASALDGLVVEGKATGLTAGVSVTYKARIQCQAGAVTVNAGSPDPAPFLQATAA
jgi:hypothetical protein